MQKKCGGNTDLRYAWYGASRDQIWEIVSHGFGHCGNAENKGVFGNGIYLFPDDSSIDSVESSVVGENGLRHVLFCRVILGNTSLFIRTLLSRVPRSLILVLTMLLLLRSILCGVPI